MSLENFKIGYFLFVALYFAFFSLLKTNNTISFIFFKFVPFIASIISFFLMLNGMGFLVK